MAKVFTVTDVSVDDIIITDRSREDMGDLTSLKQSIEKSGQLNPILITQDYVLIAGERRLTAFKELNIPTITARIMPDMSQDDLLIIEMMENVARKQFEWHEEINLMYKLHEHWKKVCKEETPLKEWGYRATAEKLGCSIGILSTNFTIVEAMKQFPQLKECQTKGQARDAYKKLVSEAQAMVVMESLPEDQKLALQSMMNGSYKPDSAPEKKRLQPLPPKHSSSICDYDPDECEEGEISDSLYEETDRSTDEHTVSEPRNSKCPDACYVVKSFEEFQVDIPDGIVGFCELDPPYAIDFAEKYGKTGKLIQDKEAVDWTSEQLYTWFTDMMPVIYKKLMTNSWCFCWTGKEHWTKLNQIASSVGFATQEPGIWVKPGGTVNVPRTSMINNYEMFLLFKKGTATFNIDSLLSTWQFNMTPPSQKVHQWQKPMDLYMFMMSVFGRPGSVFLSPFAGSGNSMIASALSGMTPMGCDISQKYVYSFFDRLNNHYMKE